MSELEVVGGTFDANGGKPSKIVESLMGNLMAHGLNGGTLAELTHFNFREPKALIWMPNVSNEEVKILPTIKDEAPHLLLVCSKDITSRDFRPSDMVGRLLKYKCALGIMIDRSDDIYEFTVIDPLGNLWCKTTSVPALAYALSHRIGFLLNKVTRMRSSKVGEATPFDIEPEFVEVIKEMATKFSGFVNAVNPNRLLGNAATRCTSGFPAVRDGARVFVTRRNVEKTTLSPSEFVEVTHICGIAPGLIGYYGDAKPSVDTPIQLHLFSLYPKVRYMIHGHVYVKGEPLTREKFPCGAVEEVAEVLQLVPDRSTSNVAINLRGHGCLIMAHDLDYLRSVGFMGRPFPET